MLFGLGLVYLAAGPLDRSSSIRERYLFRDKYRYGTSKVVVLNLEGVIIDGDDFLDSQIDQARHDDRVRAIVLRVDSPGGTISGSDYIYHHLRKLAEEKGIPLVVSMGSLAASGGYYVSMAVGPTPETIYAEPTTWTGSIGVIIPHYNIAGLMEKIGADEDSIASHRLKGMGSITRAMTEEEKQIFQELVDESFGRFKSIIRSGRPRFAQDPAALDKLATGQVYTAEQALKSGLIDRIGFLDDAVERAIDLAKLDRDDITVVEYEPLPTLAGLLFGATGTRRTEIDLAALLDLTAPRAYYLYSRVPLVVPSMPR
jgi:protease-4